MKLVQLNVWWGGKLTKDILNFLKDEDADILCLQEAVSLNKPDPALFLHIEAIQRDLDYQSAVFGGAFSFKFMEGKARFGNAVLSKEPIKRSEVIYTNLEHKDNFDFNTHDYNVRNLVHAEVIHSSKPVHVLTHHGHHIPDHKNGNADTYRQMQQIKEYIDTLSGPVILTGDFNLSPKSESLELLNNSLTNLCATNNLTTTRTNLTDKVEVCDYIFVNNQVKVNKFYASDKVVSDHQALILDCDL